jgi:hypothetical protein
LQPGHGDTKPDSGHRFVVDVSARLWRITKETVGDCPGQLMDRAHRSVIEGSCEVAAPVIVLKPQLLLRYKQASRAAGPCVPGSGP